MSSLKGEENRKKESSVSLSSYMTVHLLLLGEARGASFLWLGFKAVLVLLETKVKLNMLALMQRKTKIQCDGLENEA